MTSGKDVVLVSWTHLEQRFNTRYDDVFLKGYAKAYVDYSGKVIEGAKERWRELLLLDAVVCFLYSKEMPESSKSIALNTRPFRRQFDQHRILAECVQESVINGNGMQSDPRSTKTTNINNNNASNLESTPEYCLVGVVDSWQTSEQLYRRVSDASGVTALVNSQGVPRLTAGRKSGQRRLEMLTELLNCALLAPFEKSSSNTQQSPVQVASNTLCNVLDRYIKAVFVHAEIQQRKVDKWTNYINNDNNSSNSNSSNSGSIMATTTQRRNTSQSTSTSMSTSPATGAGTAASSPPHSVSRTLAAVNRSTSAPKSYIRSALTSSGNSGASSSLYHADSTSHGTSASSSSNSSSSNSSSSNSSKDDGQLFHQFLTTSRPVKSSCGLANPVIGVAAAVVVDDSTHPKQQQSPEALSADEVEEDKEGEGDFISVAGLTVLEKLQVMKVRFASRRERGGKSSGVCDVLNGVTSNHVVASSRKGALMSNGKTSGGDSHSNNNSNCNSGRDKNVRATRNTNVVYTDNRRPTADSSEIRQSHSDPTISTSTSGISSSGGDSNKRVLTHEMSLSDPNTLAMLASGVLSLPPSVNTYSKDLGFHVLGKHQNPHLSKPAGFVSGPAGRGESKSHSATGSNVNIISASAAAVVNPLSAQSAQSGFLAMTSTFPYGFQSLLDSIPQQAAAVPLISTLRPPQRSWPGGGLPLSNVSPLVLPVTTLHPSTSTLSGLTSNSNSSSNGSLLPGTPFVPALSTSAQTFGGIGGPWAGTAVDIPTFPHPGALTAPSQGNGLNTMGATTSADMRPLQPAATTASGISTSGLEAHSASTLPFPSLSPPSVGAHYSPDGSSMGSPHASLLPSVSFGYPTNPAQPLLPSSSAAPWGYVNGSVFLPWNANLPYNPSQLYSQFPGQKSCPQPLQAVQSSRPKRPVERRPSSSSLSAPSSLSLPAPVNRSLSAASSSGGPLNSSYYHPSGNTTQASQIPSSNSLGMQPPSVSSEQQQQQPFDWKALSYGPPGIPHGMAASSNYVPTALPTPPVSPHTEAATATTATMSPSSLPQDDLQATLAQLSASLAHATASGDLETAINLCEKMRVLLLQKNSGASAAGVAGNISSSGSAAIVPSVPALFQDSYGGTVSSSSSSLSWSDPLSALAAAANSLDCGGGVVAAAADYDDMERYDGAQDDGGGGGMDCDGSYAKNASVGSDARQVPDVGGKVAENQSPMKTRGRPRKSTPQVWTDATTEAQVSENKSNSLSSKALSSPGGLHKSRSSSTRLKQTKQRESGMVGTNSRYNKRKERVSFSEIEASENGHFPPGSSTTSASVSASTGATIGEKGKLTDVERDYIMSAHPEATYKTRVNTVNKVKQRLLLNAQTENRLKQGMAITVSPPPGETACLTLRPNHIKSDWCNPGRVVGLYADGVGPPSLDALVIGVVLDNYIYPAPPADKQSIVVETVQNSSSMVSSNAHVDGTDSDVTHNATSVVAKPQALLADTSRASKFQEKERARKKARREPRDASYDDSVSDSDNEGSGGDEGRDENEEKDETEALNAIVFGSPQPVSKKRRGRPPRVGKPVHITAGEDDEEDDEEDDSGDEPPNEDEAQVWAAAAAAGRNHSALSTTTSTSSADTVVEGVSAVAERTASEVVATWKALVCGSASSTANPARRNFRSRAQSIELAVKEADSVLSAINSLAAHSGSAATIHQESTVSPPMRDDKPNNILVSFSGEIPVLLDVLSDVVAFENSICDDFVCLDKNGKVRLLSRVMQKRNSESGGANSQTSVGMFNYLESCNLQGVRIFGVASRTGTHFSTSGNECVSSVPLAQIIRMNRGAAYSVKFRPISEAETATAQLPSSCWRDDSPGAIGALFDGLETPSGSRFIYTDVGGVDSADSDTESLISMDEDSQQDDGSTTVPAGSHNGRGSCKTSLRRGREADPASVITLRGAVRAVLSSQVNTHIMQSLNRALLGRIEGGVQAQYISAASRVAEQQRVLASQRETLNEQSRVIDELLSIDALKDIEEVSSYQAGCDDGGTDMTSTVHANNVTIDDDGAQSGVKAGSRRNKVTKLKESVAIPSRGASRGQSSAFGSTIRQTVSRKVKAPIGEVDLPAAKKARIDVGVKGVTADDKSRSTRNGHGNTTAAAGVSTAKQVEANAKRSTIALATTKTREELSGERKKRARSVDSSSSQQAGDAHNSTQTSPAAMARLNVAALKAAYATTSAESSTGNRSTRLGKVVREDSEGFVGSGDGSGSRRNNGQKSSANTGCSQRTKSSPAQGTQAKKGTSNSVNRGVATTVSRRVKAKG